MKIPYISGNESLHFQTEAQKIKRNVPQENFLYSGKIDLSNSNIKKLLTFSQKKVVFIFQETQTTEKLLIFSQKKVSLIFQETKLSYISRSNLQGLKIKNNLILLFERKCKRKKLLILFFIKKQNFLKQFFIIIIKCFL